MVEGGMKCVKYLLFAFNFLFFLIGLALVIAGAVVQTRFSEYFDVFDLKFKAVAILLIVVGIIILIIGFFGCCGAVKENYCMVMTFAVLLTIIFIIEIAAGIAGFVMKSEVHDVISNQMYATIPKYYQKTSVKNIWDSIQKKFECCGVANYTDWNNATLPPSCCSGGNATCTTNSADLYDTGCLGAFENWIVENVAIVAGVGIGVCFIQVIGIIFACCLARSIKKEYEVV